MDPGVAPAVNVADVATGPTDVKVGARDVKMVAPEAEEIQVTGEEPTAANRTSEHDTGAPKLIIIGA
jgi:hypothetical protein